MERGGGARDLDEGGRAWPPRSGSSSSASSSVRPVPTDHATSSTCGGRAHSSTWRSSVVGRRFRSLRSTPAPVASRASTSRSFVVDGRSGVAEIWDWFDDVGSSFRGLDAKVSALGVRLTAVSTPSAVHGATAAANGVERWTLLARKVGCSWSATPGAIGASSLSLSRCSRQDSADRRSTGSEPSSTPPPRARWARASGRPELHLTSSRLGRPGRRP